MFGAKRQKEILAAIQRLEKKTDDLYHFISSDLADTQQQLEELHIILENLDINNIIETMQYFNQSTNYMSQIIENAIFQVEDPSNEDNLNGSH